MQTNHSFSHNLPLLSLFYFFDIQSFGAIQLQLLLLSLSIENFPSKIRFLGVLLKRILIQHSVNDIE